MKATTLCCIWMSVLVAINEAIPRKMARNVEENKQEVSRELLMNVRDQLTNDWLDVARHLGLSEADINNITFDHLRNQSEAKLQMLLKWKERNGTFATRKALADALRNVERHGLVQGLLTGGKLREFIRDIKCKYEDQYNAVQPIPYIRDKLYCVDRVFVEGGIEYLVPKKVKGGDDWDDLKSYQDIFKDSRVISKRRILEGDPGYGKSTVTLQIAYDWCNSMRSSYLEKFEILILLRLRQLRGVNSIYTAIRRFILSKDSQFSEEDVKRIIQSSSSVLFLLDGFDEYPDQDSENSDICSIIQRKMFPCFDVIITTRTACLPKCLAPQTQLIRLTGFNEKARDEYIRKVVVGNDNEAAMKIKQQLQVNSVLTDVCQVPLFFVMFAHMIYESNLLEKFNSVTHFFGYMMGCFYNHLKNKENKTDTKLVNSVQGNHGKLDKVAFDGLRGRNQQIVWEKRILCKQLGQTCYDLYVRLGILVEEEVLDLDCYSGIYADSKPIQEKIQVRFYHKLFCEWFAAHHLSNYVGSDKVCDGNPTFLEQILFRKKALNDVLEELDPFDLQYLFRFSCGLNENAAEKIIKYLKKIGADRFAVLCVLEQEGDVGKILGAVRDLCNDILHISNSDALLLQRSTIDLLKVASSNDISISHVWLNNCYSTVYLSGGYHLQLKSNLTIPVLTTLNKLTISTYNEGKEIRAEEFIDILQYSSKCLALKELRFWYCLLPQSVQAESVKVLWITIYGIYRLNLQTCLWERLKNHNGPVTGVMTDSDYEREVRQFREYYGISLEVI